MSDNEDFRCEHCSSEFSNRKALRAHLKNPPQKCLSVRAQNGGNKGRKSKHQNAVDDYNSIQTRDDDGDEDDVEPVAKVGRSVVRQPIHSTINLTESEPIKQVHVQASPTELLLRELHNDCLLFKQLPVSEGDRMNLCIQMLNKSPKIDNATNLREMCDVINQVDSVVDQINVREMQIMKEAFEKLPVKHAHFGELLRLVELMSQADLDAELAFLNIYTDYVRHKRCQAPAQDPLRKWMQTYLLNRLQAHRSALGGVSSVMHSDLNVKGSK